MGFGHRVYKVYDPRARILRKMVDEFMAGEKDPQKIKLYETAKKIEEVAISLLSEKRVFTNVDYWAGLLMYLLGFQKDIFTPIFALARIAGWAGHVLEYVADNRIIRPRAHYVGQLGLEYIPIETLKHPLYGNFLLNSITGDGKNPCSRKPILNSLNHVEFLSKKSSTHTRLLPFAEII